MIILQPCKTAFLTDKIIETAGEKRRASKKMLPRSAPETAKEGRVGRESKEKVSHWQKDLLRKGKIERGEISLEDINQIPVGLKWVTWACERMRRLKGGGEGILIP